MTHKPKIPKIYVCTNLRISGKSCSSQGAADVLAALGREPEVQDGRVLVRESVCMGYCGEGPNIKIVGGDFHHGAKGEDAPALVAEALSLISKQKP